MTDIHRLTCKNLVKLQNDTTTCFDRTIINLTTLCCRRFHVPVKVCKLQANALRAMQYHIQTSQGRSLKSYSNTDKVPIDGTEQGSSVSGTDWLFNNVPMSQVLQKRYVGCERSSRDKHIKISKHILGNVDDAKQYSNNWIDNDLFNIMNKLTEASQTWEQLLHTSESKLEISKCTMFVLK